MNGLLEAAGLLTPLGGGRPLTSRAIPWLGVVGGLVGLGVGSIWWGAHELWPPTIAAAVTVVGDLALTGMLHVDGLADSADGLLPHAEPSRRLAIMAEPAIGTFGMAVAASALLLRFTSLASMRVNVLFVVVLWAEARMVMALVTTRVTPARPGGMGDMVSGGSATAVGASIVPLVVGTVLLAPDRGRLVAIAVAPLAGFAVVALARRRIGGYTGDVLGAAAIATETLGLLVASARW